MEKKLLAALVVMVGLLAATAVAFDPMGPPAAEIGKGRWNLGPMYSFSDMDIERQVAGGSSAKRIAQIKVHKIYANLGYGLADNVDIFVRAGVGNLEWDRISGRSYDWDNHGSDWNFIWGAGVKGTLCEAPDVSWGFLAQFSNGVFTGCQEADDGEYDYHGDYEIILREIQIAAGPTWKAAEGWKIYGGPFVNLISGRWQDEIWGDDKPRKPIEEESWLGAYVGTQIDVAENTNFSVEYQMTSDGWAAAGGLVFRQ